MTQLWLLEPKKESSRRDERRKQVKRKKISIGNLGLLQIDPEWIRLNVSVSETEFNPDLKRWIDGWMGGWVGRWMDGCIADYLLCHSYYSQESIKYLVTK